MKFCFGHLRLVRWCLSAAISDQPSCQYMLVSCDLNSTDSMALKRPSDKIMAIVVQEMEVVTRCGKLMGFIAAIGKLTTIGTIQKNIILLCRRLVAVGVLRHVKAALLNCRASSLRDSLPEP